MVTEELQALTPGAIAYDDDDNDDGSEAAVSTAFRRLTSVSFPASLQPFNGTQLFRYVVTTDIGL